MLMIILTMLIMLMVIITVLIMQMIIISIVIMLIMQMRKEAEDTKPRLAS